MIGLDENSPSDSRRSSRARAGSAEDSQSIIAYIDSQRKRPSSSGVTFSGDGGLTMSNLMIENQLQGVVINVCTY